MTLPEYRYNVSRYAGKWTFSGMSGTVEPTLHLERNHYALWSQDISHVTRVCPYRMFIYVEGDVIEKLFQNKEDLETALQKEIDFQEDQ